VGQIMLLHELQSTLLDSIFNPALTEIKPNQTISETRGLSAAQQLDIYRGSVVSGMIGALAETYPVCKQLVGNDFFDSMVEKYVLQTPSIHPDLNVYGGTLAEFIDEFKPVDGLSYLSDVARLEWLWSQAFSAGNEGGVLLDELAYISEYDMPSVVFIMSQGAGLLQSNYPVDVIWKMHRAPEENQSETINLDQGGVKLIVWRENLDIKIEAVENISWVFLILVQQQKDFASICERILQDYPDVDMGQELAKVIQAGWVQSFRLS